MTYTLGQLINLPPTKTDIKPEDAQKVRSQINKGKKEWSTSRPLYLGTVIKSVLKENK